jgi:hypothetical protein
MFGCVAFARSDSYRLYDLHVPSQVGQIVCEIQDLLIREVHLSHGVSSPSLKVLVGSDQEQTLYAQGHA